MPRLWITGGDILTPFERLRDGYLLIEDGVIREISTGRPTGFAAGDDLYDASGLLAAPGFIDLQINGGFGRDFTDWPESMAWVAGRLPEYGVTAFLPTIISSPMDLYRRVLSELRRPSRQTGARILGVHFEGPYISPARPGAHDLSAIRSPAEAELDAWQPLERVRLVTLAPELPGAERLIERLLREGVTVSAGHTDATYDEATRAFSAGVRYVTHLFNTMRGLHHRDPGLLGATLTDERPRAGVIADGIHLHPAVVRLAWRALGPARTTLVTDAMAAMGQPAGEYRLGDRQVTVRADGSARLADGTLAGSTLTMDRALRNLMEFTECSLADALQAATTTPSEVIGEGRHLGRLAPGYAADIALLTPEGRVAATFVAGALAYRASSR